MEGHKEMAGEDCQSGGSVKVLLRTFHLFNAAVYIQGEEREIMFWFLDQARETMQIHEIIKKQ